MSPKPVSLLLDTAAGRFAACDFGGRGRDVLLVHGTGHNLEVWRPLVGHLDGAFRLIAFDLRGHGQTTVESTDAERYWRDIAEVSAALGLERPLLVGHSTGAYAVTAYAADGGDCSGIVLLDGFVLDDRKTPQEAAAWRLSRQPLWERFRYGWTAGEAEMEAYVAAVCERAPADSLNRGIDPAVVAAFTRRAFLPTADGKYRRRPSLEDLEAVCRCDVSAKIYPAVEVYDRLSVPVGFVFATHGFYAGRKAEVLSLLRPDRCFVEIDSGHNVHMQKPAEVASFILRRFG